MLKFLETFKKDKAIEEVNIDERNTLIVSLLIEAAKFDHDFSDSEIDRITQIIKYKFNLDEDASKTLFDKALELSQDNVEIYSITKDIRDNFEREEILDIFKYVWEVILADGHIDDFESSLMTKLTGLFHLTGKEAAELKNQVLHKLSNQN